MGVAGRSDAMYRASAAGDVVFHDELGCGWRGVADATSTTSSGRRGDPGVPSEPLGSEVIRRIAPDVAERDVYLCGPKSMMASARRSLRALAVPDAQIHWERFAY